MPPCRAVRGKAQVLGLDGLERETSGNSGVIYHQLVGEAVEGLVPVGDLGDLFPQPGFWQGR